MFNFFFNLYFTYFSIVCHNSFFTIILYTFIFFLKMLTTILQIQEKKLFTKNKMAAIFFYFSCFCRFREVNKDYKNVVTNKNKVNNFMLSIYWVLLKGLVPCNESIIIQKSVGNFLLFFFSYF